jgi:hypothetical protein
LEEFEERIERTLAAKTLGDLDVVTRDLPAVAAPLAAPTHAPAPATPYTGRRHLRELWTAWGTAVVISVAVWAGAGGSHSHSMGGFWPIWVAAPWGAVLLARTLFGGERERPGRQHGERDHL